MYKSYSYDNMPIPKETKPAGKSAPADAPAKKPAPEKTQTDDILLALVILMLLMNDCDDKLLLLALAYIFISERL